MGTGIFAAVGLVLAAVGVYGAVSNSVSQRTREMGIRMALGAHIRDVLELVVKRGLWLILSGLVLGLAGAFALTRAMSALLYGVTASDPVTFGTVSLLLGSVALLTCWIPARRTAKIDLMEALRYE